MKKELNLIVLLLQIINLSIIWNINESGKEDKKAAEPDY